MKQALDVPIWTVRHAFPGPRVEGVRVERRLRERRRCLPDNLVELRNTSVSANGLGVQASDANFAVLDHSNFFENSDGDCSSCSIDGNLQADPRYVDPAGDFRLRPDSDLIDQGIDLRLNLNGSAPGLFYGAAIDIGGRESW